MIYLALGINKSQRIQLFHNNIEYNSHPNLKLSFYFPTQEQITFLVIKKEIDIDFSKEEEKSDSESNTLYDEVMEKCNLHFGKYCDYFCYDCNKVICFQCFISGLHKKHKYKYCFIR